jgi:predicted CoA-binding protein
MNILNQEPTIRTILGYTRRIAIVGLSRDPTRPSHGVAQRLLNIGYEIVPVNPTVSDVLGFKSYPALADVPGPIDLVDVFRRSTYLEGVSTEAVAVGARALWLQRGLRSEDARRTAEDAGMDVVENRCLAVEAERLERVLDLPPK